MKILVDKKHILEGFPGLKTPDMELRARCVEFAIREKIESYGCFPKIRAVHVYLKCSGQPSFVYVDFPETTWRGLIPIPIKDLLFKKEYPREPFSFDLFIQTYSQKRYKKAKAEKAKADLEAKRFVDWAEGYEDKKQGRQKNESTGENRTLEKTESV